MIAVDTNVLARWVLGDDPVQTPRAAALVAESVFISLSVLLELGWVLHKSLGFERTVAAQLLEQVLALDTATIEQVELAQWATERFSAGADWGDMIHVVAGARECTEFATFDRRLARHAGPDSPLPIILLAADAAQ